jgi:hypothetical protein
VVGVAALGHRKRILKAIAASTSGTLAPARAAQRTIKPVRLLRRASPTDGDVL